MDMSEEVVVEAQDAPAEVSVEETASQEGPKKKVKASKGKAKARGKKYSEARTKVDPNITYSPEDAAKLVKETSTSKFVGSVEMNLVLHKDKLGSNQVTLPNSTGATKRIEVASEDTIKKLQAGKIDFDVLITTPAMMAKLVPFAKLLGPRGLMPNPKNGTVSDNPEKAKEAFGGNTLHLKLQKGAPLLHMVIGKVDQEDKALAENMVAVLDTVGRSNVKKAVVSASMGPSVKLAL